MVDNTNENAKGFTLLELVITLAVIAVAGAIASPAMMVLMSRGRLNGAARQVMNDMMWARMESVTQKNEFRIFFISDHAYKILDDDNNDGQEGAAEWAAIKDINDLYRDVRIRSTGNPIFFPRGNASTATVTVANGAGEKKVKVHMTGRVKISAPP